MYNKRIEAATRNDLTEGRERLGGFYINTAAAACV